MNDDIVNRLRSRSESWEINDKLATDCIDASWDREAADEIERLRAEFDSAEKARLALLRLLTEFYETCTEEQQNVEMLCLHRAAGHLIAKEEARRG